MSHYTESALKKENRHYYLSIALTLFLSVNITITEIPTSWVFNKGLLVLLFTGMFFGFITGFMHLRWDKTLGSITFLRDYVKIAAS